jgi:hypothetical protein
MLVIAAGLIGAAERAEPSALCWCAWCSGPGALAKMPEHAQAQVPVRPAERRHIVELLQHHDVHDAGYFGPGNAAADPRLRIELVGKLLHAKVIEQRPRRQSAVA